VREMKVWPFGVALRGEAPNHHMLRWLKTVVVSDVEKAPGRRQVGIRKMSKPEPLWTCRYKRGDIETVARLRAAGAGPGGSPDDWSGGVRHGGGMSLVCGSRMEHGKARLDTVLIGR
jgi:hypothetical protein